MAKRILLIKTGGTLTQGYNERGERTPGTAEYPDAATKKELEERLDIILDDMMLFNIDSTEMETKSSEGKDRAAIAKTIYDNADTYDGFVVGHGTDSMAETAAALTYMLKGFGKPIVVTGSQIPIMDKNSDAPGNVYAAIQTATENIGEVVIAFWDKIIRGTRVQKLDAEGFEAFDSPRVDLLGLIDRAEKSISLTGREKSKSDSKPELFTEFETGIFNYMHTSGSGVDYEVLKSIVENEKVKGVIMGGFGSGNIPTKLVQLIEDCTANGKPVAIYTRCQKGSAASVYEVGAKPIQAGGISAADMTPEALGQKMMYALGLANREGLTGSARIEYVKDVIQRPINNDINYS